jgi:hypothetical protein
MSLGLLPAAAAAAHGAGRNNIQNPPLFADARISLGGTSHVSTAAFPATTAAPVGSAATATTSDGSTAATYDWSTNAAYEGPPP